MELHQIVEEIFLDLTNGRWHQDIFNLLMFLPFVFLLLFDLNGPLTSGVLSIWCGMAMVPK